VDCSLVVIARANVPGEGTPVLRNYLVDDTESIGTNCGFDGKTEIDVMI
jgi:hypothetical protein